MKVDREKFTAFKPAPAMAVLGPWIGEIQVDSCNFIFSEDFIKILGFHPEKIKIADIFHIFPLLNSPQKYAGIFFDSYIIVFRMQQGQVRDEAPLPHADFQINRMIVAEYFMPGSFFLPHDILVDDKGTGGNDFAGARNISKTHGTYPLSAIINERQKVLLTLMSYMPE